ncbi:MAG: hypothetical protein Q9167_007215 [Letrouitia subvulpina]
MITTRIAVLECDPLIASIRETYGSYGDVVTGFLQTGANHLGLPLSELDISTWNVEAKQEFPALQEVDAILVTGSNGPGLSAYDDVDWINKLVKYIKVIIAQDRVKLVGLCFSHQVIGRALGATAAINSLGYELSVCNVVLSPLGARIFGKTLGMSPVCQVQGMFVPGRLMTLQGHPEFDDKIMVELLKASKDLGFEDDALIDDAMSRVNNKHDGTLVAAVLLKFIGGLFEV